MKVQQIVALILLLVCIALPPLHSWAVESDDSHVSSRLMTPPPTHSLDITLVSRTLESQGTADSQPASTTPSSPHCDFEVSPIDQPPHSLFAPPEFVRAYTDQLASSPLSFTIDITSPPPRLT